MTFGRVNERHGSSNAASAENSLTCTNFNKFFLITCNGNKFWTIIHLSNFNEEKISKAKEVKFKSRHKRVARYSRKQIDSKKVPERPHHYIVLNTIIKSQYSTHLLDEFQGWISHDQM